VTEPYRILVTGSRDWDDAHTLNRALGDIAKRIPADRDLVVVHGACRSGADNRADTWARRYGATRERHPAQNHPTQDFGPWPAAGPRRNAYMVSLGADVCIAFIRSCSKPGCRYPHPHGSHGAAGCANLAESAGIPVRRWFG
jgi:hypothetical protein